MQRKQVEGGFITLQGQAPGLCYVLTGPWRPELAGVMRREGAQFLRLSRALGWQRESLEFVSAIEDLRGVEIYHSDVSDLTALLALTHLELLGLECRFRGVDFASSFPKLRFASVTWRPGCESLFRCRRMEYFSASNYPCVDLSALRELAQLRQLFISSRQLLSATGMGSQPALRVLTLSYCSSLHDISGLAELSGLENVQLATCKKVRNVDALGMLKQLRRLIIENAGEIDSVRSLSGCTALQEIFLIGTKVADGDLTPLLALDTLRRAVVAKSDQHSHTTEQLNAALAGRPPARDDT